MVSELKNIIPLKTALNVFDLAPSSYYYCCLQEKKSLNQNINKKPLDPKLTAILKSLTGLELALGYNKTCAYINNNKQKFNGLHFNKKKKVKVGSIKELVGKKHP